MLIFSQISSSLAESQAIIQKHILSHLSLSDKIFFIGDVGAGKTFLIKNILNQLNVQNLIHSPTFNLINEYYLKGGEKVLHVDFYRFDKLENLIELDLKTELMKKQLVLLEWGDKFPVFSNWITKKIFIEIIDENKRKITLERIK